MRWDVVTEERARELVQALFVPGIRYGWFARDLEAEIRPYPEPFPADVSPHWRREHQVLQAAVDADSRRLGGLAAFGAEARRRRKELEDRERYVREGLPELQGKWERDCAAWDEAERRRVYSQRQHVPKGPGHAPRRSDIVGGDLFGWRCLLTTFGTGLLAGGARLDVLDLTERGAAFALVEPCQRARVVPTELTRLPEDAAKIDLFSGLDDAGIASMLVESLSATTGDRAGRLIDRRILDAALQCLNRPITPARLTAALRLFLGGARTPSVDLDDDEFDRLQLAFPSEQRTALLERLTMLEATLAPLEDFGALRGEQRPLLADVRLGGLHCVALTGSGAEVVNELLLDLVVQGFIRQVTLEAGSRGGDRRASAERVGTLGGRCAIVLGAERVVPSHLKKLNDLSVAHGFGLVFFFADLTDEIANIAAHDADVLGIMRLTNYAQAERAASLIGPDEKLEFSSLALSDSQSEAVNWGWSSGESSSPMPFAGPTLSQQESGGGSRQTTTGNQVTYSKVHQLVVKPEFIQGMGSTAIAFTDLADGASRRPISLDVHPYRALGP